MNPESGYKPEAEGEPIGTRHEIPENIPHYTKYEEVRLVDNVYEHPSTLESMDPATLEEKIADFESLPELQDYHNLPLNFTSLDHATEQFAQSPEADGHEKLVEQLKNVIVDIKFSVSQYYKSVMVFERTHMNRFQLEPEEHLEKMKSVDQHRTLMHNKLIDAVVSYTRLCNKIIPEQTDYHFDKNDLFDPHLVLDLRSDNENIHGTARRRIATWAFLNERGIHIEKAAQAARDVLANKKAAPESPKPQKAR
jgi:hypothetical protein